MTRSGSLPAKAEKSAQTLSRSATPARALWLHQPKIPWLTNLLVRYRRILMALCVLFYLLSFNGRWRIGLDSSIYRGLARNIARGEGYHFGEFGAEHAYPGLPLLLAGVNKLVGDNPFRPALAQFLIVIMALLTIWVTYRLIQLHYPEWMAVTVACGLAINGRFLELSNELLTDVPFLLGLMSSLYGWELLRAARAPGQRTRALTLLTAGLLLAAVMRPTFWVLALAWLCACAWGLIVGPRKFYLTTLAILLLVWIAFACFDPRTKGFAPLGGGYEREAISIVTDSSSTETDSRIASLSRRILEDAPKLLAVHLPAAFLGQVPAPALGVAISLLLIGSSVFMIRRHPIWALLIPFTVGVTIVLSTAPRYFVMILPMLLLGSLLLLTRLTDRIPGGWGDLVLLLALGAVTGTNIGRSIPFIVSQHSVPISDSSLSFYTKYRDGKFLPVIHMADIVRQRVRRDENVVAPAAPVLAYLSDRPVLMERDLLPPHRSPRRYPEYVAAHNIRFAVFPASAYRDKNPELARLIQLHVINPTKKIARTDGLLLARVFVYVPPGDWREGPHTPMTSHATTKKSIKHGTTKRAASDRKHKPPTRHRLAAPPASTQSTTQAAPVSKKKKPHAPATTSPTTAPAPG